MKRLLLKLLGLLLLLSAAPSVVWACPECRAEVNSGVYGQSFTGTLLVMLLPLIVLALICVGIYYADDIKVKLKERKSKWQTT